MGQQTNKSPGLEGSQGDFCLNFNVTAAAAAAAAALSAADTRPQTRRPETRRGRSAVNTKDVSERDYAPINLKLWFGFCCFVVYKLLH